ncbi:hypothetical protein MAR621_00120 [Maribacter dokdonensis]|uniref:hypothetical protein n=1 Tax=Maribacter dokdonensis TaxID=320912 RepID=UPI001B286C6F|nr:hypothetical protein [Maribacter dokdonensis]CAG2535292.1 hypothetical protein MAR621_00120 [Maribacter dokdonensis]
MNINEFWGLFEKTNKPLSEIGFVFKGKSWQFENDSYKISVEAPTDKLGISMQVRLVKVCLMHKGIIPYEEEDPWDLKEIAGSTAFHISPDLLSKYKNALLKNRIWHYKNLNDNNKSGFYFKPVYYGGDKKWIMKDKSFSEKENKKHLLWSLKSSYGINYITEKKCYEALELMADQIKNNVFYWAEKLTLKESIKQLEKYGDDWWITENWKEKYKTLYNTM